MDFELDAADRDRLLVLARSAIAAGLGLGAEPPLPPGESLARKAGAFVTIHLEGRLRGCIGRMRALAPLGDTVLAMARAAAFEDPRFPPLSAGELAAAKLEITVLSPLRAARPDEVVVGLHGILVSGRGRSGVLLPQVAVEQGWDRETFLSHTCLKAGLPPSAWREAGTGIEIFEGIVFGEEDKGSAGEPGR